MLRVARLMDGLESQVNAVTQVYIDLRSIFPYSSVLTYTIVEWGDRGDFVRTDGVTNSTG